MNKALFLDRDGIINIEKNFVHKIEDFEFVDGIFDLVSCANGANYLVVVITNQAGIGRGYYSEEDFHLLMNWVQGEFLVRGGRIDRVYFCPFHPEFGVGFYRQASQNRKPEPGMFYQASADLNIDLTNSIMVGDRISDMQAAARASIPWRFCMGDCEQQEIGRQIRNLYEVIDFIKEMPPAKD
jgi:D-glycero-D-manno-heptose 1,7-bisphosphate phosphatase